ncbi:hypothetical protein P7C73_g6696, partial [Tremellales sp. Uapishka_1]
MASHSPSTNPYTPASTNTLSPPDHTGDTPLLHPLSNSNTDYTPPNRSAKWDERTQAQLAGWRGGNGPPRSNYPQSATPGGGASYFGTSITGIIGRDLPKEMFRIERDWSGGEVCQFYSTFPMELEGRISPLQFQAFINDLNGHLVEAYSLSWAIIDNLIAIASWWTSLWWHTSRFEKELRKAEAVILERNGTLFNPAGLNVLSPRDVALQFVSG